MAIDFTFPPEIDTLRLKVRDFVQTVVRPAEAAIAEHEGDRRFMIERILEMREAAKEWGLWLPHMPAEFGGMGLSHVAMASVSAEAAKSGFGPFALNAQAPDEGNMHTLLHWATDEQKERYLRPLCEGRKRSCFAMTEPEVAGSDPTLIRTSAVLDGDEWVVNGHKWFISGARGASFAILIARTEENPEIPQAGNSAFLVDLPSDGWAVVYAIRYCRDEADHSVGRFVDGQFGMSRSSQYPEQGRLVGRALPSDKEARNLASSQVRWIRAEPNTFQRFAPIGHEVSRRCMKAGLLLSGCR
jgi:acyl-CoA dehydrogenase